MIFLTEFTSNFLDIVQPQITPFEFGEEAVDSGDMATLTCAVHKGDFPISIDWFLNNQSVSEHHGISILRTNKRISQLSIDSVQAEHNGVYECVASNSAGVARHSAQLRVNGSSISLINFYF